MKCLIIAAGLGSRLRSISDSKPLVPVRGVPLLERVLGAAHEAGADEFYVVIGYHGDRVRTLLRDVSDRLRVPITPILNDEWEKPNGLSVLKARQHLQEPFLLLMGDHLFDPAIARRLASCPLDGKELVLAVDTHLENPLVDLEDVTRVWSRDGQIQRIGKGLEPYNAFDTGIFLCQPELFSALEQSSWESGDASLSGGVRVMAKAGRARVLPVPGSFWIDIDDPAAFHKAEQVLTADYPESR